MGDPVGVGPPTQYSVPMTKLASQVGDRDGFQNWSSCRVMLKRSVASAHETPDRVRRRYVRSS